MGNHDCIDLFCGCGGLSSGFTSAGFNVVVASDIWNTALETYKQNLRCKHVLRGDMTSHSFKQALVRIAMKNKTDIVIGSPPCQAFSTAGYRNALDDRLFLVEEFIHVVSKIKPILFVMENVTGMLNARRIKSSLSKAELKRALLLAREVYLYRKLKRISAQRKLSDEELHAFNNAREHYSDNTSELKSLQESLMDHVIKMFNDIGYRTWQHVFNAANYGVPQNRKRGFIFGIRSDLDASFIDDSFFIPQKISNTASCRGALQDLECLPGNALPNHVFTKHSDSFIKKIKNTKNGESVIKTYGEGFYRLKPDEPSPTVKENHGSVFIHYSLDRCLTPRELARLQSFPDDFEFIGSKSAVLKQIGNAVPPLLAFNIAKHLKNSVLNVIKMT